MPEQTEEKLKKDMLDYIGRLETNLVEIDADEAEMKQLRWVEPEAMKKSALDYFDRLKGGGMALYYEPLVWNEAGCLEPRRSRLPAHHKEDAVKDIFVRFNGVVVPWQTNLRIAIVSAIVVNIWLGYHGKQPMLCTKTLAREAVPWFTKTPVATDDEMKKFINELPLVPCGETPPSREEKLFIMHWCQHAVISDGSATLDDMVALCERLIRRRYRE